MVKLLKRRFTDFLSTFCLNTVLNTKGKPKRRRRDRQVTNPARVVQTSSRKTSKGKPPTFSQSERLDVVCPWFGGENRGEFSPRKDIMKWCCDSWIER